MEKAEGDEEEEEEQGPQLCEAITLTLAVRLVTRLAACLAHLDARSLLTLTVRSGEELGGGGSGDDPENEAKLNELSPSLRWASMASSTAEDNNRGSMHESSGGSWLGSMGGSVL